MEIGKHLFSQQKLSVIKLFVFQNVYFTPVTLVQVATYKRVVKSDGAVTTLVEEGSGGSSLFYQHVQTPTQTFPWLTESASWAPGLTCTGLLRNQ